MWPEAANVFNAFYGMPSLCMYHYRDTNGTPCIGVIWGRNGTRMGCVFGSIGFDMAVHHNVYSELAIKHTDVDFKSLTDDLPMAVPAPPMDAPIEQWEAHYDYIAVLCKDYDDLLTQSGCSDTKTNARSCSHHGHPFRHRRLAKTGSNYISYGMVLFWPEHRSERKNSSYNTQTTN